MKHLKASSSTSSHKHHFFKFLFPDPLANQCIPRNFCKHLPTKVPKQASLVTQSGKVWRVDACQNEEEEGIYFSRGWSEFAKAHDLRLGYFVVFQYEGNMVFNVEVFDTTCCLKDYSLTHCNSPTLKFEHSNFVDPTSDVKSDEIPVAYSKKSKIASGKAQLVGKEDREEGEPILKGKKKIQRSSPDMPTVLEIPVASDKKRKIASEKVKLVGKEDTEEGEKFLKGKKMIQRSSSDMPTVLEIPVASDKKRKIASGKAQLVSKEDTEEEEQILKEKKKIQSGSTDIMPTVPQFKKILNRSSVSKYRNALTVPKKFCVQNGLMSERCMFLVNSKGKKWQVKFSIRGHVRQLTKRWHDFLKKNGLKERDECVFQLINKNTFRVKVVKNNDKC